MAEEIISKDRMNYTIDVLITMVVEELSEDLDLPREEILTEFLMSKTGKALYDESTKLWCNGPSYIADMYKDEIKKNGK